MSEIFNPLATEDLKQQAKWEMFDSRITQMAGVAPGRRWKFEMYPKMMYKAMQEPGTGKWKVSMDIPPRYQFQQDDQWSRAVQQAEQFGTACQKIVNTETEHEAALKSGEGWQNTPQDALLWREKLEKAISTAAAERNDEERHMSEKAIAERDAVEQANMGRHLPEIPEQPRAKRKYTRKTSRLSRLGGHMDEFPRWVHGGGVVVGGEDDGKTLKDLLLLVDSEAEAKAVAAGTARLVTSNSAEESDIPNIAVCRVPLPLLAPRLAPESSQTRASRAQERADLKAEDLADERAEDREQSKRKR